MTIARELANLLDTGGDVKLNQLDNYFLTGTKLFFPQAAAPTGWTQDPTASLANRSLRVVTGAGGGTGGSHDLNSPPSIAHTHTGPSHTHTGPSHTHTGSDHTHTHSLSAGAHTLTEAEMPSHSHTLNLNTHSSSGESPTGDCLDVNTMNTGAYSGSTATTGGGSSPGGAQGPGDGHTHTSEEALQPTIFLNYIIKT